MKNTKTEESNTRVSPSRASLKSSAFSLPNLKTHLTFWSLMAGGLVLDLWTKKAVFEWLESGETFPVIDGFLQLVRALNNGAAFGWLAGRSYLLTLASIIALVVIFTVFLFSGSRQKSIHIALGLFAAGVCGNLYDRIFNDGLVRDFIDVYYQNYHWPAFNVADSLLCIGVGLLIISTLLIEKPARKRAQQRK